MPELVLHHRELATVGLLLREVAARSEGGYVLIRRGKRRDSPSGDLEWRVSIKLRGRQWTHVSLDGPGDALARALHRLLNPEVHHDATIDDHALGVRTRRLLAALGAELG